MIEATDMEGVFLTSLRIIADDRGSVMKLIDDYFEVDGYPVIHDVSEVYFSTILAGVVKGWHGHKYITLNYACVFGKVRIGLADRREMSSTFGQVAEVWLDDQENYRLLTIPPGVWNGFKSYRDYSIVVNAASHVHDPNEIERIYPRDFLIPFDWGDLMQRATKRLS
jgi:dTDP-4-dehydrorhamnose 3,5-epimerase